MPSLPRYAILEDNSTFHITWQCHNKDFILEKSWTKQLYYDLLLKYKNRYKVKIYSYCFMSSHPHLTGHCETKEFLSDFFRIVNSMFARKYNKIQGRRGQVVMDRFKSPIIKTEADHLKVMFYNDLNPKRAHMVAHPRDFKFSSYHYYAYGKKDLLITPAPSYLQLGLNDRERQQEYRSMVEDILKNDWHEKKPYSSVCFIGDPDWVNKRNKKLKEIRLKQIQKYKRRYLKKFGTENTS